MKIPIRVMIALVGKPDDGYKSQKPAEEFMRLLLNSETARKLAIQCKVELPDYAPAESGKKLYWQLGFWKASPETHTFSCWEQEEGGKARKVREFPALAGEDGAAEFNGNIARAWKNAGGKKREDEAGIHLLLSHDDRLVKTLWVEADRKET